MIYEFITPSDPITFRADNDKIAFFCALLLGSGKAGMRKENGESPEMSPLFLFHPDPMPEIEGYLGKSIADYGDEHSKEISDCFLSFAYGSLKDRKTFDDALEAITDAEKLKDFKAKHEDRNRTSLSMWVKVAWKYGKVFLKKSEDMKALHTHNDDGPIRCFGSQLGYEYTEVPNSGGTQFYRLLNGKFSTDPDGNKLIFQSDEAYRDSTAATATCTCGVTAIETSLKEGI